MKRPLKAIAAALLFTMMLIACDTEQLTNLQQQIDELKSTQVASIETQLANIKTSIESLQTTDTELRGYITTLQEQQSALSEEDQKLAQAIEAAKASLSGEITAVEAGLIAQLEAYKTTVAGQIAALNTAIENLQAKDAALQQQITDLKTYSDGKIQETKEWATATFVTLQKYNETTALIATIQGQISSINTQMAEFQTSLSDAMAQINQLRADLQQHIADSNTALTQTAEAITAAYTTAIEKAITASETSLKNWVNTQLTAYYTAAQIDAKLAALQAEQEQKLNQQKTYVETLIANLQTVLEGKINNNKALIDGLQGQVNTLSGEAGVLAKGILDNADSIANNAARINENAQAIAQNTNDITACETLIASNKALIAANETAIAANDTAIVALQAKAATNEQGIAGNVVNIAKNAADIAVNANLIAANATAISNNATAISDNAAAIAQLRTDLQTSMATLTEGYQSAIQTAITTLDGKLTGEIATNVTALNTRISQEVEAINTAIAALDARVTTCENEISAIQATIATILADIETLKAQVANILSRIQSIVYVPTLSSGAAEITYSQTNTIIPGFAEMDFRIQPKELATKLAEVWQTALTMEMHYTETRSAPTTYTLIINNVSADNGYLTVIVSGEGLDENFYSGGVAACVTLVVSDGNNELTTEYIPLRPRQLITAEIVNNITETKATLNGQVCLSGLRGATKNIYFYYSESATSAEGLKAEGTKCAVNLLDETTFDCSLNNLCRNKKYYYVAEVDVAGKEYFSPISDFTTADIEVDIKTGEVVSSCLSALLNDTISFHSIDPFALNASYLYSETASTLEELKEHGIETPETSSGNLIATKIKGLKPVTTYHYVSRLIVDGEAYYGQMKTFTTNPIPENAVDMGLSVIWHEYNLGASNPEGLGDYYAWGETETKMSFSWENYSLCRGAIDTYTKYCTDANRGDKDDKLVLEPEDDASTQVRGLGWRTPTDEEWEELRDPNKCTWLWTTLNEVKGYRITSLINGNSLFLPTAEYGWSGDYWSSSLSDDDSCAWFTGFDQSLYEKNGHLRYDGLLVRPVCD